MPASLRPYQLGFVSPVTFRRADASTHGVYAPAIAANFRPTAASKVCVCVVCLCEREREREVWQRDGEGDTRTSLV